MTITSRSQRLVVEILENRITPVQISFGSPYGYDLAGSNGRSAAIGDINGDSKPDLVVSTATALLTLLNDGTGKMVNQASYPFGQGEVRLADVSGEGKLDIVVSQGTGAAFTAALGNGDGTFQQPLTFAAVSTVQSLDVTDMNGDGKKDVVCSIPGGVVIHLNNGSADLFGPAVFYGASPVPDGGGIATGDFTGDGFPDVVQAGYSSDRVYLYPNNGDGTLGTAISYSNAAHAGDVTAADFNGDGNLDVATTRVFAGSVAVYLGNGNGTLQNFVSYPLSDPGAIAHGDFDLDGDIDLAVSIFQSSRVEILPGNGVGGFGSAIPGGSAVNPSDITVGDINGDVRPDIVTPATTSPASVVITPNTTPIVAALEIFAPATAIGGIPFTVAVTATNSSGATMTDYTGRVHFTSTDGFAILPPDLQFTPADNGVKTFEVTLFSGGVQSIIVGDVGQPTISDIANVDVTPTNIPPTANNDLVTVAEDSGATTVNVLANDTTAPDMGETLTISAVTQGSHGAVAITNGGTSVIYTPSAHYHGPDAGFDPGHRAGHTDPLRGHQRQ